MRLHLFRSRMASSLGLWLWLLVATSTLSTDGPHVLRAAPPGEGDDDPAEAKAPGKEGFQAPKTPLDRAIDAALDQRKLRKYAEAFRLLKDAEKVQPDPAGLAKVLFRVGETQFRQGLDANEGKLEGVKGAECFDAAMRTFGTLLEKYPREADAAEASYLVGSSHLVLGAWDKALAAYTKTYERYRGSPQSDRALLRMGVCQMGLDKPRDAKDSFARYLKDHPGEGPDSSKVRRYVYELQMIGKPAPPLHADQWLFGQVSPEGLRSFEGDVVVVLFFATWCENCSREMPRVRRILDELSPRGAIFLGVANPKDPKNTEAVDVYVREKGISFLDVALDEKEASWSNYRVGGLPAAALIDRQGVVRWRGHMAFFPESLATKLLEER